LYYVLKDKGAVYGAKYGWERVNWFAPEGVTPKDDRTFEIPNWFEHVAAEHKHAREKVVLIDQSSFSKFEIEGPGALNFLNRLCANQIDKPVGKVIYTQMCNERGTIECDMTIARLDMDRFFLVVGTAFALRARLWIEKHLPRDNSVFMKDVTSAYAVINVAGPLSRELLQKVSPDDVGNTAFPFATARTLSIGYAPVTALRITYVGELGYELYIPTEFACHVYETLWEAGKDLDIRNAGYRIISSMHLEKGYSDWGSELSPEYTPFDAGLGFCVALGKDDFIGKDALTRIKTEGPAWKLCTFTLDADAPVMMQSSAPIVCGNKVIGTTTSSGYGHTIGKTICYGYIPADYAQTADAFEIEAYKTVYPAKLEENRALYDPDRLRILA
jgi:4-methylaminobutanoate oxidase (formaldehyde-forming)